MAGLSSVARTQVPATGQPNAAGPLPARTGRSPTQSVRVLRSRGHARPAAALAGLAVALSVSGASIGGVAAQPSAGSTSAYTVTAGLVMVIKYYEGIPTAPSGRGDTAQSPSLSANRGCLYNDGDPTCWSPTSKAEGNCTIGWGHLFYPPHLCAQETATFPKGMTLYTANWQLGRDLEAKVSLVNSCLGTGAPDHHLQDLDLDAGQLRSLVGLVYQQGSPLIGKTCKGELTTALEKAKSTKGISDVLVAEIKKYHGSGTLTSRGDYEIWDATGGDEGSRRPAIWTVATAIEPAGAPGKITITPTGTYDSLAGVTPEKSTMTCASTEGGKARPQVKCGKFYLGDEVDITASTDRPEYWQFVGWRPVNFPYDQFRDLCVVKFEHDPSCKVPVQDQLVRAVAVFKKRTCTTLPPTGLSAQERSGCGSQTTTTVSSATTTTSPSGAPSSTATTSTVPSWTGTTTTTGPECASIVTCPPAGANVEVDGDFPGKSGAGDEWGIGIVTYSSQVQTCPANGEVPSAPCMQPLGQTLTGPFPEGSWAAQFNDQPGCVNGYDAVGVCYPVWPRAVTVTFTAHAVPVGGESASSASPEPNWGSVFVGWAGACSGAGQSPTCTLDLAELASNEGQGTSPPEVVADFAASGAPVLGAPA